MDKNHFFFLFCFTSVLFIYLFSYFYSLNFSIYGVILFSFLIIQLFFSILNKKEMIKIKNDCKNKIVNILVVGYREDPEYWQNCLKSIKIQTCKINKIQFNFLFNQMN